MYTSLIVGILRGWVFLALRGRGGSWKREGPCCFMTSWVTDMQDYQGKRWGQDLRYKEN